MKIIYNYSLEELQQQIKPSFRAKQIYNWIYKKYVTLYSDMKNIPKDLKLTLEKDYPINICKILKVEKSDDGTKKYLFEYEDGKTAETVLLLMKDKQKDENGNIIKSEKYTFCLSTQVG